jgi:ATP-dependent RNA helicase DDX52/ROK1
MPQELLDNLAAMGATSPTPIQMQAPSIMLADRDLLACAPTGSGKTLSFLLPALLSAITHGNAATQARTPVALVVEPTRELARQVYTEAARIKSGTRWRVQILGEAEAFEGTESAGDECVDLIITTPLKLVFAAKEKTLDLSK